MITTGKGLYISQPNKENYFLQFIKFMRQAPPNGPGWLIAGSCNNIIGTMGQDVINNVDDIVPGTWVVLETPDRMVQLMFHIYSGTAHRVYYNPNSDYAGGGVGAIPMTTSADYLFYEGELTNSTSAGGLHITAEETFPYNFAVCSYPYNSASSLGGILFARFDIKQALTSDHFFIVDTGTMFDRAQMIDTNLTISIKCVYDQNVSVCAMTDVKPLTSSTRRLYPNNAGYRPAGNELFVPTMFANGSSVLGVSNFVRWTPLPRSGMRQYANRSILSHNQIAFPWDGVTIPSTDPKTSL